MHLNPFFALILNISLLKLYCLYFSDCMHFYFSSSNFQSPFFIIFIPFSQHTSLFFHFHAHTLYTHTQRVPDASYAHPPILKKQVKKCILWVIFSNLRCRFVAYSVNCLIGYIVFVATWFIVSLLLSFSRACRQGIKVPYFW